MRGWGAQTLGLSLTRSRQIIAKVSNFSDFGSQTDFSTRIESHCVSAEVTNLLLTADNARGAAGQAAERARRRHHRRAR
jgi:hypothetical protein